MVGGGSGIRNKRLRVCLQLFGVVLLIPVKRVQLGWVVMGGGGRGNRNS